jgi:HlyD family secretion protein
VEAAADVRAAESRLREMQVLAPGEATVEVLDVRPGDVIAPNVPIATLLERNQLYVRVFVPEPEIGHVRVGQKADLFVDSFPGRAFPGMIEQINQQAEFLPRNVQTTEERAHQVIGVKVRIEDADHLIRAGVAATVKLRKQAT